jgi:hypothetical protein
MQWNGFKVPIVLLTLAVGLTVLLGAQWAYNKYSFQDPLVQALGEETCISDFSVNDDGEVLVIKIELDESGNLMEDYQKIDKLIQKIMNNRAYHIELVDNPDDSLLQAYYNSQFVIHEAIVRGNFRQMAEIVHESAEDVGGSAKVYVGPRNIYLQMTHENHNLFRVISRDDVPGVSSPEAGGGENYYD